MSLPDLAEITVRGLAYELLIKEYGAKRGRKIADFYLLQRYGDDKRGIKANMTIAAYAKRLNIAPRTLDYWKKDALRIMLPAQRERLPHAVHFNAPPKGESELRFKISVAAGSDAWAAPNNTEEDAVMGRKVA